ncbi:MAG: glycosyltransferase family 4 protein [Thermoplasmata archaeon]
MQEIVVRFGINEGATHSLYREFIDFPPDGVKYITDSRAQTEDIESPRANLSVARLRRNELVRSVIDRLFVRALPRENGSSGSRLILATGKFLMRLAGGKKNGIGPESSDFDLFHSAGSSMIELIPWIIDNDIRWIADFEHAPSLFGYYGDWRKRIYRPAVQRILAKQLESDYCRKLLPWTEAGRQTLENLLPDKRIKEKLEVLRLAVRPAPKKPGDLEKHDSIKILFIGSSNFMGEFWSKGGYEVLEAYKRLREKLGEQIELTFRCWMPEELRKKYGGIEGLRTITEYLPKQSFERLFWESDIFLFPSHNTPGMALLDAMRFGLPIVTKDIWANRETVEHEVNGLLVEPSRNIPYYLPGFIPNWSGDDGPFLKYMRLHDERVIEDIVLSVRRLVDDSSLRNRLGSTGKKMVEEGRFSIKQRNTQLRRIYEEAARK